MVEIAPNHIHQKKNRTDLGKSTHLYDETQGNNETQVLSIENCLCQVQEDRQIIIKEEGSKEDDRQGDDVILLLLRMYT